MVVFPSSREKVMVEPGNCFGSVRSSFVHCFPHCVLFHRDRTWDSMLHVFIDLRISTVFVYLSVCRFFTFWKTLLYEKEKLYTLDFVSRIRFEP